MIVILMIVIVITKDKVCCRKINILIVVLNIFGIYVNEVVHLPHITPSGLDTPVVQIVFTFIPLSRSNKSH